MKCRACGNEETFIVEGKDIRLVDSNHPSELRSYFVVVKAVCTMPSCGSPDVYLDPPHPTIKPYADQFGF